MDIIKAKGIRVSEASYSNLFRYLECPICLDVPVNTPIYFCSTGHNICQSCFEKLNDDKRCGLCNEVFGLLRNFVVERFLKTVSLKCENIGCTQDLNNLDLDPTGHIESCDVRSADGAVSFDLLKDLDCFACLKATEDIPMYVCQNEHNICENCCGKKKEKLCTVCEIPLSGTRNFALETLLKKIVVRCNFAAAGCDQLLKVSKLKHVDKCDLRSVRCLEVVIKKGEPNTSCNITVDLDKYEKHLTEVHDISSFGCGIATKNRPLRRTEFFPENEKDFPEVNWPVMSFRFNKQTFLRSMSKWNGSFYWWVTLIGSEKEASQYIVTMKIGHETLTKGQIKKTKIKYSKSTTWTHQVHSCNHDFNQIRELGDCASVPDDQFIKFCFLIPMEKKYRFSTIYSIEKVKNPVRSRPKVEVITLD